MIRQRLFAALLLLALAASSVSAKGDLKSVDNSIGGLVRSAFSFLSRGKERSIKEAPFIASIRSQFNTFFCSAAIVDAQWVVTSARCVSWLSPSYIRVSTGTVSLFEKGTTSEVERILTHPSYSSLAKKGDIALVKLKDPLDLDNSTATIEVASEDTDMEGELSLYTWGYYDLTTLYKSSRMQEVRLRALDKSECDSKYPSYLRYIVAKGNSDGICSVIEGRSNGLCDLKGGAPIVADGKTLVGIAGKNTICQGFLPGLYLKIGPYADWIRKEISK